MVIQLEPVLTSIIAVLAADFVKKGGGQVAQFAEFAKDWIDTHKANNLELTTHAPAKRKGLILMVSQKAPCEKAIRYHLPVLERCWLLCSEQTRHIAEELRHDFPHEISAQDFITIVNINDPLEYCQKVDNIYHNLPDGWGESAVIADYLGMTAHGSVGMALACMHSTRPIQYTLPRYDEHRNPIEPEDPIEIVLNWEMFGAAPGDGRLPRGKGQ